MKIIQKYPTGRSIVKTVETEAEFAEAMLADGPDNFIENTEIGITLNGEIPRLVLPSMVRSWAPSTWVWTMVLPRLFNLS
jgi:hypothetical protein